MTRGLIALGALALIACDPAATSDAGADAGVDLDASATFDAATPDASPPDAGPGFCAERGCLRRLRPLGDYDADALRPFLEPGVVIDNGYSLFEIEYVTRPPPSGDVVTSLATVAIPFPATPPPEGYPIVANAHGTVGIEDPCTLTGTVYGSGLAGLFGARGAIGVTSDYPGLGTPGLHPYLVAASEGAAVLDSLIAAAHVARDRGVATSGRYAVAGLSQGGHASLAAAAMHASYAPELDVRAFAAAAPATVWLEHWREGVALDGPHVAYHAMAVYAYAAHYGHEGAPLFAPSLEPRVDGILRTHCAFDFGGEREVIADAIGGDATAIFDPAFLAAYRAGALDDYLAIARAFAENRVEPYAQTAPLAIWQGDADTTVPEVYTTEVVAALRAGGVEVDYRVVPGGEHIDTAFGFVAQHQLRTEESLAWVLDRVR